ncbi:MAG: hypothetical protein AB7K08_06240 [Microbacteriaceae bacterium]
MDAQESWQRAADLLIASHDVWESPKLSAVFPDGLEKCASAIVATTGADGVTWVETRADLEAPKVEAAVFCGDVIAHLMLTGEGFGFEVRRIRVESVRATSVPLVHAGAGDALPFRFTARFDSLEVSFPWDPDNAKQDAGIAGQFARLLAKV